MLALAMNLCVLPLAFLTLTIIALVAVCAVHALPRFPIVLLGLTGVRSFKFGTAVGLFWSRFGSGRLAYGQLLLPFVNAIREVLMYLTIDVSRQMEWLRSTWGER